MMIVSFSGQGCSQKSEVESKKLSLKASKSNIFEEDSKNALKRPNPHYDPYPTKKTSRKFKESASHHVLNIRRHQG